MLNKNDSKVRMVLNKREYEPQALAFLLILGIIVGVLGSRYGWFAPVHEVSHIIATWAVGGRVVGLGWDWFEFTSVPHDSARFRFLIAAGAVGEHLVALAVMIWALWRAKPFLSAIGFGYLAHGMGWAWNLREWRYLRQPFFDSWYLATGLVYVLLVGIGFTYVSWVSYAVAQKARPAVQSHVKAV